MSTSNAIVDTLFQQAGVQQTMTKAGWCLRQGLTHLLRVNEGRLLPLVQQHGLPGFYLQTSQLCRHDATQDIKDPKDCFQSLVRIIAGQFVSGSSAQAAWKRIQHVCQQTVTPQTILDLTTRQSLEVLQKPAGLTRNKAAAIVDLAKHFCTGQLSEQWLVEASEEQVRTALLAVKGLGPWSVDMFLMFTLEKPNVLPLGDLGVRKGLSQVFGWKGSAAKGQLCPKKDAAWIQTELKAYEPFCSLLTYYMWRAADTPNSKSDSETPQAGTTPDDGLQETMSPKKPSSKPGNQRHSTVPPLLNNAAAFGTPVGKESSRGRRPPRQSTCLLADDTKNEEDVSSPPPTKRQRRAQRTVLRQVTP